MGYCEICDRDGVSTYDEPIRDGIGVLSICAECWREHAKDLAAMDQENPILAVTPEGERPFMSRRSEFIEHNAADPEVCDIARKLTTGESVTFGGGAAPIFRVKRLDRAAWALANARKAEEAGSEG